jgi:hypothetical protein
VELSSPYQSKRFALDLRKRICDTVSVVVGERFRSLERRLVALEAGEVRSFADPRFNTSAEQFQGQATAEHSGIGPIQKHAADSRQGRYQPGRNTVHPKAAAQPKRHRNTLHPSFHHQVRAYPTSEMPAVNARRYGTRHWAVWLNDKLIVVALYKKGALAVAEKIRELVDLKQANNAVQSESASDSP